MSLEVSPDGTTAEMDEVELEPYHVLVQEQGDDISVVSSMGRYGQNSYVMPSKTFKSKFQAAPKRGTYKFLGEVLPPGTLWVNEEKNSLIIQEPPTRRVIDLHFGTTDGCNCHFEDCYCNECEDGNAPRDGECSYCQGAERGDSNSFDLPFPWMIYVVMLTHNAPRITFIGTSSHEITGLDQNLHTPYLPNVYSGGGVCHGDANEDSRLGESLMENASTAMSSFWGSEFNMDIRHYIDTSLYDKILSEADQERDSIYLEDFGSERFFFTQLEKMSIDDILKAVKQEDEDAVDRAINLNHIINGVMEQSVTATIHLFLSYIRNLSF